MEVKLFLLSLIYFIKICVKSESDLEKAVLVNTQSTTVTVVSFSWGKKNSLLLEEKEILKDKKKRIN